MDNRKSYLGIYLIGVLVVLSNALLAVLHYFFPLTEKFPDLIKVVPFVSMAAIFPYDFFWGYLREMEWVHLVWIAGIMVSTWGILLWNKIARIFFILMNIIHIMVLAYIVISKVGQYEFLNYFFKLYFNLVAAGSYVGFITIPEVREQFQMRC